MSPAPHAHHPFLSGGGDTGALIRAHDWASTPLGDPSCWPPALRAVVSLALSARQPMYIAWGPALTSLYNDAYVPFCGAKHPGGIGQPFAELWAEVWDALRPRVEATLAGEAQWREDEPVALTGRDQPMSWFTFGWTPLRDDAGVVHGFLGVATETTGKVLALRQLAEEREGFAQLFEQAPTFMAVLRGPTHVFELANPGYLRLIGNRSILGRTVAEALPEAAAQGYVQLLDRVYTEGQAFTAMGSRLLIQTTPGGPEDELFLDFVYQPIRDSAGAVTGIFVDGVDVTDRTRSEVALRESETRLRSLNADLEQQVADRVRERSLIWELSVDLLGVLNQEGVFETSNPAWHAVLGWSAAELSRTSIFELIHPDDVARTHARLFPMRPGESILNFENRFRTKDGHFRSISWSGVPAAGKYYCSGRDITSEFEARTKLSLAQEALRQSQKMEAVGQLTGGIAHDFNNLLTGIGGSLEVLERRFARGRFDGAERYIAMGQSSVRRAAALTQRLLAFSRRQTLDPAPTDIVRLVVSMEDLIRRTMGPTVRIDVDGDAHIWPCRVDASQLESSLLNLCINARDAMLPHGGELRIACANTSLDERHAQAEDVQPGDYVTLRVHDSGCGMPPEVMAHVFEPFFTTKPLGQGTGLGLSMVYGFVRQSGGQVRIQSTPGQGTTVSLYFPKHTGDASLHPAPVAAPALEHGGGESILVIEDEPTVRQLVVEVLSEAGYRVAEAHDGPAALQLLESSLHIDLVISDVGLPGGMNGRQVADAARVGRPGLPVLFITGYAENAAVGDGQLAPGMAVIVKPFEVAQLTGKVQAMLASRPYGGASS
jgi:PAS domain S-box-containing protein